MFKGYNILNVIWDVIRNKLEFAEKRIAQERYELCKSCEVRNKTFDICTICGCRLTWKVKMKKSTCPMEKW
jgi:hypothetical protein